VVAGGGEGVREVGVMDMELSVLLVVLSSTQLPSISFLFVVVVVVVKREEQERQRQRGMRCFC
jgi:hypothetical protein